MLEAVGVVADEPDFAADEAELGGEQTAYRWHLSRAVFNGARRTWETCTSYPAGQGVLTADVVREDWGPGIYYAQLRPAPGSGIGHGAVKKTRTFTLAAPRAATVAPGATSSTETLLQKMIESQQSGFLRLGEILAQRPQAAGADPNQLMDLALRMAERMQPKRPDSDSMLETMTKFFEFSDRMRGGGKGWPDLVSEGISTFRPLVEAGVSRLNGGAAPAPANGSGAPAAAPQPNTPQPKIEGPPMLQLANYLQRQVRFLTGKAKAGASANLYAEVTLDNLPEAVTFPQLLELLKAPDALDRVFSMMPADDRVAAEGQRAWFEELVREMIGFLDAQVNGGAAPAPGDRPDAKSDTPAV